MGLPIRTTLDDIETICAYLAKKPSGAALKEASAVLDQKYLDGRKLSALRFWGLLDGNEDRLVLSTAGRELARGESWREAVLSAVIRNVPAYNSIIDRAALKGETEITSVDAGAHWFTHFKDEVSPEDTTLSAQAVCFFHVAAGAGLGRVYAGRRGAPTRFEFVADKVQAFASGKTTPKTYVAPIPPGRERTPATPVQAVGASAAPAERGPDDFLHSGLTVDCYRLDRRIGSGFSAEVWSANVARVPLGVDLAHEQQVAIKFYTTNALAIPDQFIRIEREYRIAQRLRHAHLIRIYEFVLASPRPYHNFLVMDLAPGPTLATHLAKGKFEIRDSLRILAQILAGTAALHEAGALHRDIKPGNIALSMDSGPNCVLLDLGIVSPMFEKGVTAVSRFVGSKHWAPLEQLIGARLDERSDLYSIGAVAYNLLVGVEPFSGSATEAAVAVEMTRGGLKVPELSGVPSEIVELFNACLSISADQRPASAAECLAVLRKHSIEP